MYLLNGNPDIDDMHKLPKPCDYFDMIAGTSTGGWVLSERTLREGKCLMCSKSNCNHARSLRRLCHDEWRKVTKLTYLKKLDVETCIKHYIEMAKDVFQPKVPLPGTSWIYKAQAKGAYDHKALESKIQDLSQKYLGDRNALFSNRKDGCKVYVSPKYTEPRLLILE